MAEIIIHSSVKIIGNGYFEDCSAMERIVIPSSVTSFGASCSSLIELNIHSVKSIGEYVLL